MPKCEICAWICGRVCADFNSRLAKLWADSSSWEYVETGYYDLREEESEAVRAQLAEASSLGPTAPEHEFENVLGLAKAGSPSAMILTGLALKGGWGTPSDLWQAMDWFHKAASCGSWSAMIHYARALDELGYHDLCDQTLNDGIEADFATARFQLARSQYVRNPTRKTAQSIRPLLDQAIASGHPGAEFCLARLTAKGKFGFRNIRKGVREARTCLERYDGEVEFESNETA